LTRHHKAAIARDAVSLDLQALLEHQENRARTANPERQEFQEPPDAHRRFHASQSLLRRASHAHRDHPDHQDLPEPPVTPEHQDNQDAQETMLHQANQDQRDLQDRQENQACPDPLVNQELRLSAKRWFRENQARLATKGLQDHQDLPDSQAPTDCQEHQDQKDPTDRRDHLEMTDNPELRDHLDLPGLPARRVSARDTAPSTVECSSRTELAVKSVETRQMSVHLIGLIVCVQERAKSPFFSISSIVLLITRVSGK